MVVLIPRRLALPAPQSLTLSSVSSQFSRTDRFTDQMVPYLRSYVGQYAAIECEYYKLGLIETG